MSNPSPAARHSTDQDPRYTFYEHPSRVVTLDYPIHWVAKELEDFAVGMEFASPEVPEAAVGIYCFPYRIPVARLGEDDLERFLHGLLEQVGATESQASTLMYYPSRTARIKDGSHSWVLAHEDVGFAIQVRYPDDLAHIYQPLFDSMLSSFRLHREGAGARMQLLMDVLAQLNESCPTAEFKMDDQGIRGEGMQIGVENLSAMIARQPESRLELIEQFVGTIANMLSQTARLGAESWEEAAPHILPMIRQGKLATYVETQLAGNDPDEVLPQQKLVSAPWLANLIICYAIDDERSLRMINQGDLERWQKDANELHEVAMKNLAQAEFPSLMGAGDAEGNLSVALLAEGGISAKSSYALHPRLHQTLHQQFPKGVWLAIPSRDALVAFSKTSVDKRKVLEMVAHDFKTSDNAISDRLFESTPDGLILA
jgi:uncharacterized protein YtpQ (UPF0354 family)